MGENILKYNSVVLFSGRQCSHRQRDACGDFANLESLRMCVHGVSVRAFCECLSYTV